MDIIGALKQEESKLERKRHSEAVLTRERIVYAV